MTVIDALNRMNRLVGAGELRSNEIALYTVLLLKWNELGRSRDFNLSAAILQGNSGLSKSAVYRVRNSLKQKGLIDFRARNGNQSAVYRILGDAAHDGAGTQTGKRAGRYPEKEAESIPNLNGLDGGPFSKRHHVEYERLHVDLQGAVDLYELSVKGMELDDIPVLLKLNGEFTAGQIRAAIMNFSKGKFLENFRAAGLSYIVQPLRSRMFGKPKGGSGAKDGRSDRLDAVKGPKFENGPDLGSIVYKGD